MQTGGENVEQLISDRYSWWEDRKKKEKIQSQDNVYI